MESWTRKPATAEIAQIMVVFGTAGLTSAALNGIAAESSRNGGTGARQLTELDVLLDLAYHSDPSKATMFTRHFDDILVPRIRLDLTPSTYPVTDEQDVQEILNPGHDAEKCGALPRRHDPSVGSMTSG